MGESQPSGAPLADPAELAQRRSRVFEPHVEPLNRWVESLRSRLPLGSDVPWFDPADGGIHARLLWFGDEPDTQLQVVVLAGSDSWEAFSQLAGSTSVLVLSTSEERNSSLDGRPRERATLQSVWHEAVLASGTADLPQLGSGLQLLPELAEAPSNSTTEVVQPIGGRQVVAFGSDDDLAALGRAGDRVPAPMVAAFRTSAAALPAVTTAATSGRVVWLTKESAQLVRKAEVALARWQGLQLIHDAQEHPEELADRTEQFLADTRSRHHQLVVLARRLDVHLGAGATAGMLDRVKALMHRDAGTLRTGLADVLDAYREQIVVLGLEVSERAVARLTKGDRSWVRWWRSRAPAAASMSCTCWAWA
jgi:hypothetical protein